MKTILTKLAVFLIMMIGIQQVGYTQCSATTSALPSVNACVGNTTTNLTVTGVGTNSYTWSTIPVQTGTTITVTPVTTTTYTVTATGPFGCSTTSSITITVTPPPTTTVNAAGPTTFCQGGSVVLSSSTAADTYQWYNGLTPIVGANLQNYTATANGTYKVYVTSTGCSNYSTNSVTVTVNANPTPSAGHNGPICAGQTLNLTSNGGSSYLWSGPNGFTSNVQNPSIVSATTAATGHYTVAVTNAAGCTASVSTTMATVHATPTPSAGYNGPICAGQTLNLTSSGGSSYLWSGSNGFTSNVQNPSILNATVDTSGTYTVAVTNASGCTATAHVVVVVNPLPVVTVGSNSPICEGTTLSLTSTGVGTHAWSGPLGFTSNTQNPIRTNTIPTMSGIYTDVVTNVFSCSATDTTSVVINPLPTQFTMTGGGSYCAGGIGMLVGLNGSQLGINYQLLLNGANYLAPKPGTGSSLSWGLQTISGVYTVVATNAVTGCVNAMSGQSVITINPLPNIQITTPTTVFCGTGLGTLTATITGTGGNTYQWQLNTVPISGATTTTYNFTTNASAVYTIVVTDSLGCSNTKSQAITVNPLPAPAISGTSVLCQGNSTTLTATGGTSYAWNTGATTNVINVTPATTTTYTVTVTNSFGCTASTNMTVTVNPNPVPIITGTTVLCLGQSTTLTANSGTSYLWSTGMTGPVITVSPAATTTYSVTVTNAFGCTTSTSAVVTVNPLPVPLISGTSPICNWDYSILTATGGMTYQWNNGVNVASQSVTPNTTTTYTVTATNIFGCTASTNFVVVVNPLPIQFNVASALNPFCQGGIGGTVTLSGSEIGVSYQLQLGGVNTGSPQNGTGAALTFPGQTTAGIYTITATNTTTTCDQMMNGSTILIMDPLPLAAGTITGPITICQGQSVVYSINPITYATGYTWSVPSGATITNGSGTTTISVSYGSTSSSGSVTVYGTNACGNGQASALAITVYPNPIANIVPNTQTICSGTNINISATGGGTYLWSTGATTNVINVTPAIGATTYTVTVTGAGGCTATATSVVTVDPTPTVNVNPINPSVCQGQNVTLTATGGSIYAWSNGANTASISVAPGSTTTYTVTGTNSFGCSNTASTTVTVNPLPTAGISGNNNVCFGQSTTLTATGGASYLWNTGANTAVTSVTPTVTTPYTVTVYSASGCTSTASTTVTVNPLPTVTASNSGPYCVGDMIQLTSTAVPASTFSWSGPNGIFSTSQNPTLSSATTLMTGTYIVTATTGPGCTNIGTTTVIVNTLPVLSLGGGGNVCSGNAISLAAAVANGTFIHWTHLGNVISTSPTPTLTNVTTAMSGYYVATASNGGCLVSDSILITVNQTPTAGITGTTTICNGASTTLTGTGGGTYVWSTTATTAAITVNPTSTTTYTVTVTETGGCTATASTTVTVNLMPAPVITPSSAAICNGQSVTLDVTGGTAYVWSDGSTTTSITVSPTTTTTYSVTATNTGCSATNAATVTVNATPTATINPSAITICSGQSATLMASSSGSGNSYLWNNGGSTTMISVSPITTTTYTVTITNLNGCTATASTTVTVNPAPNATASASSTTVCPGSSTTLTATGGSSYHWSTGATSFSTNVNPTVATTYTVTVTNTNGCTATADVTVNVYVAPTVNVTPPFQTICAGTNHTLTATLISGASYVWSNGQTGPSISVSPTIATTYMVTVTNANGCTASAEANVSVNTISSYASYAGMASCPGGNNGYVNVAVNGLYPYLYAWTPTPPNGQGTSVANNLTAGVWSVFITDANGCQTTTSVTITEPSPIIITPSVNGSTATVSVSGGTPSYEYLWSPTPVSGQFTHTATFASGVTNVQLTVTDGHNCQEVAMINLASADIDEISGSTISVYPNPATDVINLTGIEDIANIQIFNTLGQLMITQNNSKAKDAAIAVSEFTPGTYFIVLTNSEGNAIRTKFVKQ